MFRINYTILLSLIVSVLLSSCTSVDRPSPRSIYEHMFKAAWEDGSNIYYDEDAGDIKPRDAKIEDQFYNGKLMDSGFFDPVYFRFDSMAIDPDQRPALSKVAEYLNANPGDTLLIEGRCDWHGTEDYNIALGEMRANSVALYLADLGISTDRIETKSIGSLESIFGLSKTDASIDRRAEIILLK